MVLDKSQNFEINGLRLSNNIVLNGSFPKEISSFVEICGEYV